MAARTFAVPRMPVGGMLGLVVALLLLTSGSEGRRGGESCPGGRALGDKWFDGCHWCVCSVRGVRCSRSECSSLVQKVRPCHVVGQKWTDGCYRCRCKRHGIACRLDVTCLLLRHHPVPCLADDRCVCGPDGVPSCTAEVIDRHAFAARRVDLGIPAFLTAEARPDDQGMRSDGRRHGGKVLEASPLSSDRDLQQQDFGSSSQELLITSDNLCRFGPRWYGGSLRCFCDIDGAITCGNPTFVSAFFDDFKVKREECEEGHVWEEGCSVCTCRLNGVVFCRHDHNCRRQYHRHGDLKDDNGMDHYLPGFIKPADEELNVAPALFPAPTDTYSRDKITSRTSTAECIPGSRWKDGCKHCRCDDYARAICSLRHCSSKNSGKEEEEKKKKEEKEEEEEKEPVKNRHDNEASKKHHHHQKHHHENDAKERPMTMKPFHNRGPRGPMMKPPRPATIFRPPAYTLIGGKGARKNPCGRFKVGAMYWDDCNLCLCTSRGPKCQGKLCR